MTSPGANSPVGAVTRLSAPTARPTSTSTTLSLDAGAGAAVLGPEQPCAPARTKTANRQAARMAGAVLLENDTARAREGVGGTACARVRAGAGPGRGGGTGEHG